tara:strand:- start:856 stop:1584 length:729 start_codon:yes stop_codon:yes gene_type:complete
MRHYIINKINHVVYESESEVPKDLNYKRDWRDGHINDWVLSDDGCVIQVLRRGSMTKSKGKVRKFDYIGTCTGTFIVSDKTKMDTSKRINIYSLGGHIERNQRIEDRQSLSSREELFAVHLAAGMPPREAYLKAFPTNDPNYAAVRAGQLVKTTRIKTAMKEELKPVMEELDIDPKFVLEGIKYEATSADKADTRLKALFKLSDILDMEDKNKTQVTQLTGAVFQGFSKDKLKEAERPKEIK